MIPFYIFYSMFGFQRTGDFAWAFGDARGRGFLMGATAGRTTLTGEGLQHDDGHSHILASVRPEHPRLRPGLRVRAGADRARRHPAHVRRAAGGRLLLHHPLQRELGDAAHAGGRRGGRAARPLPLPRGRGRLASGPAAGIGLDPAPGAEGAADSLPSATTWPPTCGACRPSSCCATTRSRSSAGTACTPMPRRGCRTWCSSSARREGPIVAATDYLKALPHMIAPWMDRPFTALGTDGFGRSDTREALRIHFEVSPEQIAYAALHGLCLTGAAGREELVKAISRAGDRSGPTRPAARLTARSRSGARAASRFVPASRRRGRSSGHRSRSARGNADSAAVRTRRARRAHRPPPHAPSAQLAIRQLGR